MKFQLEDVFHNWIEKEKNVGILNAKSFLNCDSSLFKNIDGAKLWNHIYVSLETQASFIPPGLVLFWKGKQDG